MLLITTSDSLGRNSTLFFPPCFAFLCCFMLRFHFIGTKPEKKELTQVKLLYPDYQCWLVIHNGIPNSDIMGKKNSTNGKMTFCSLIKIRFLRIFFLTQFFILVRKKVYAFRIIETRKNVQGSGNF